MDMLVRRLLSLAALRLELESPKEEDEGPGWTLCERVGNDSGKEGEGGEGGEAMAGCEEF